MMKQLLDRLPIAASLELAHRAPVAPEPARNARFSTVRLATNVTLNYLEQGDPAGEPLILLHGYTDSWHSYVRVLPLLSKKYRVYALDQRGHGNSSKAGCCYTMDDFTADVIAFMDAKGIEKATLVGHSMGSMIAQLAAGQHPERVSRLVLIGSMTAGGSEGVNELNEAVQALVDPIDPEFVREFQLSTLYGEVPAEFLEQVIAESLRTPAHVWRQALASFVERDTTGILNQITAPTFILWGNQDLIFPRSDQDTLVRLIAQATLVVYEETGHGVHWEQPERFVADLEQIL